MYVDSQARFSSSQAVTATALSTDVMDLLSPTIGGGTAGPNTLSPAVVGGDVYLVVQANAAFAGTGTIAVTLETANNAALTSSTVVAASAAIAAPIAAGTTLLLVNIPPVVLQRYLGVRYTVTGTPTGGTVNAFLSIGIQQNVANVSGFVAA